MPERRTRSHVANLGKAILQDREGRLECAKCEVINTQPDVKRYVRHYIQCFITGDRPAGPNLGDTDGIAELWFDNIDGFNAFANSPSYLNVIKLDEERFTDPKKCEYFFSEERQIIK